jgi:ribonucleoside-diphosphate reductase alpha chain
MNSENRDLSPFKNVFEQPISRQIWRDKYQFHIGKRPVDHTVQDTWHRVAEALAAAEMPSEHAHWSSQFYAAMDDFKLIPAGRILAGCGTGRDVTLCNTFVMQTIPDSLAGIMDTAKDAALTMKMGGGLGFDFSTLRPKGARVHGIGCDAAGPLPAMDICDAVCKMVVSGMGRGAMMATLRCDHPDIEAFVMAKSDPTRMRNFNLSVLITDSFMDAVRDDGPWNLTWQGETRQTICARDLWAKIMQQTYAAAEPGVLFIDRINDANALNYTETIAATNSCAEQPLPPYGACPLASINLARLVQSPFMSSANLDLEDIAHLASVAVRMLDNVVNVTRYPLDAQKREAQSKRRIGLGITGVADALVMLGIKYGSVQAKHLLDTWMQTIQNAGYLASAKLAQERGCFPAYNGAAHMKNLNIRKLAPHVQKEIKTHGLRNGLITTIAPTGTTSLFAGNVSSGIEPIFSATFHRKISLPDGNVETERVVDYAVGVYRQIYGDHVPLPDAFVTVRDLTPDDHISMQSVAQRWVDSGISKTVNCPEDISFTDFESIYLKAYATGCKGCTTFRPNPVTGSILSDEE